MEPSTGKILAMVSKPDFDPNTLAANWSQITGEGSDSVLVNRATQGLYPPGSTFKLITMLEYLREHKNDYGQYHYICDGTYELGNNTINCVRTKNCRLTLNIIRVDLSLTGNRQNGILPRRLSDREKQL